MPSQVDLWLSSPKPLSSTTDEHKHAFTHSDDATRMLDFSEDAPSVIAESMWAEVERRAAARHAAAVFTKSLQPKTDELVETELPELQKLRDLLNSMSHGDF